MKILIEKFDSSAPSWIREFLSQKTRSKSSRASSISLFPASSAIFTDVSNETVTQLRRRLKSGEDVLFFLEASEYGSPNPLMVTYNSNNSNNLNIVGYRSSDYKDMSFKKLAENAIEIYYTNLTSDVTDLRKQRRDSRSGIISRKGDSAKDVNWIDIEDRVVDASGYVYDGNRLVKKLIKLNAGDSAKLLDKAITVFENMADAYSDTVKKLSRTRPYDTGTFSATGFSYIIREGERVLSEAADTMNTLIKYAESEALDLQEFNKIQQSRNNSMVDQEEFDEIKQRLQDLVKSYYIKITSYSRRMKRILAGQDRD